MFQPERNTRRTSHVTVTERPWGKLRAGSGASIRFFQAAIVKPPSDYTRTTPGAHSTHQKSSVSLIFVRSSVVTGLSATNSVHGPRMPQVRGGVNNKRTEAPGEAQHVDRWRATLMVPKRLKCSSRICYHTNYYDPACPKKQNMPSSLFSTG